MFFAKLINLLKKLKLIEEKASVRNRYSKECATSFFRSCNHYDKVCLLPSSNIYKMNENDLVNYSDYTISIQNNSFILSYVIDAEDFIDKYYNFLESEIRNKMALLVKNEALLQSKNQIDKKKYILKKSVILELYETFGDLFEGETEDMWLARFIDEPSKLPPINIPRYKVNNANHLILNLLYYLEKLGVVKTNFITYVSNRWSGMHFRRDYQRVAGKGRGEDREDGILYKDHEQIWEILTK